MLKWAVSGSTSTAAALARANTAAAAADQQRHHGHRHMAASTPLHVAGTATPRRHLLEAGAYLSDLSRITTNSAAPLQATPVKCKPTMPRPNRRHTNPRHPYASTLPTFDVEYSPGGQQLVPGPMLALRGIEIPDAYFGKPRYLPATLSPPRAQVPSSAATATATTPKQPVMERCSADMSDATLEHMIDAILENTASAASFCGRLQRGVLATRAVAGAWGGAGGQLSPTYTRAEDPASDLPDILGSAVGDGGGAALPAYRLSGATTPPAASFRLFREREVCSPRVSGIRCSNNKTTNAPTASGGNSTHHLRRQCAVRRKAKSKSRQSKKFHTRKLLSFGHRRGRRGGDGAPRSAGATDERRSANDNNNRESTEQQQHICSDSGRDSSSSLEEDLCVTLATAAASTKRRLSFSHSPCATATATATAAFDYHPQDSAWT